MGNVTFARARARIRRAESHARIITYTWDEPRVPVSSIRKDYLLSEAVELIGRRIYGGDWSGSELYARP